MRQRVSLVWLRRDLRLDDHVALLAAARDGERVACAFVLDPGLLRGPRVGAPIVQFFFDSLDGLRDELAGYGSALALLEGDPAEQLLSLSRALGASALYYNVDYEPGASARDARVTSVLEAAGVRVHAFSDHVYYGRDEVLAAAGTPYAVFGAYRRRWEARFAEAPVPPAASAQAVRAKLLGAREIGTVRPVPRPEDYGHVSSASYPRGGSLEARRLLDAFLRSHASAYETQRNVPAADATSHLSPHLRAGTIGIRTVVRAAAPYRAWLGELIWRDFYQQLLAHHPRVAGEPYLAAAHAIRFRDDPDAFRAWCEGRTGYPIVDAALAQLNATGWMHNRLRMIAASFFTKHLLLDYRAGERYFEQHLADADLAANNGGWQWSASTGTDAAPYFRVFNPTLQGRTFDPHGTFVRAWLPALRNVPDAYVHAPWTIPPLLQAQFGCTLGRDYPVPIVDHRAARERALAVYGAAFSRR